LWGAPHSGVDPAAVLVPSSTRLGGKRGRRGRIEAHGFGPTRPHVAAGKVVWGKRATNSGGKVWFVEKETEPGAHLRSMRNKQRAYGVRERNRAGVVKDKALKMGESFRARIKCRKRFSPRTADKKIRLNMSRLKFILLWYMIEVNSKDTSGFQRGRDGEQVQWWFSK